MAHPQAKSIRAKKLGVLIRDAREASGKSKKECAEAISISTSTLGAYERGAKSPSLPELEMLAYFLDVPVDHFWGSQALSEQPPKTSQLDVAGLIQSRQASIGDRLQQARNTEDLSLKDLASQAGVSPRRLRSFENGRQPVPVPELEAILAALNQSLKEFMDPEGPVSNWINEQEAVQQFLELPVELQAFVSKPINRPFLEVAQRLSQMPVDQLRQVAEGLLEITF